MQGSGGGLGLQHQTPVRSVEEKRVVRRYLIVYQGFVVAHEVNINVKES